MELINAVPPRPILSDDDLAKTQARINQILDQPSFTQDDRDYLNVLGMLVYDYEDIHEPMPELRGIECLNALIDEGNLQSEDFKQILGHDVELANVLNHQYDLTVNDICKLAQFFQVSPVLLLPQMPIA